MTTPEEEGDLIPYPVMTPTEGNAIPSPLVPPQTGENLLSNPLIPPQAIPNQEIGGTLNPNIYMQKGGCEGESEGGSKGDSKGDSGRDPETEKRVYKPNDGKHRGSARGDVSADPFWNNQEAGQESLDSAYSSKYKKQLYNVYNGKLVEFQPDNAGTWHGYEVQNSRKEVPIDVLRNMKDDGLITNVQYNKWIKNK